MAIFVYFLYIILSRIFTIHFFVPTRNLKLRRDLGSHKTVVRFVAQNFRKMQIINEFFKLSGSHSLLVFYRKHNYYPRVSLPDTYPKTLGVRSPLFFKVQSKFESFFVSMLERQLAESTGLDSVAFIKSQRLFFRTIVLLHRRRQRRRKLFLQRMRREKLLLQKQKRKGGPKFGARAQQKIVSIPAPTPPPPRPKRIRFLRRRRIPRRYYYRRYYSLRWRRHRRPTAKTKQVVLASLTEFSNTLSTKAFAYVYFTYRLFLRIIRRRRHQPKKHLLRPQTFEHSNIDFLYDLLKSVRMRKWVERGVFLRKKRRWRYFFLKKKLMRKIIQSEGHKSQFLLRKPQNLDSGLFFFIPRLSRRLLKHRIKSKPISNIMPLLSKLLPNYQKLRATLLKKRYYLFARRKRSNFYFTVVNHLGEVIFSLSTGRFVKKRLKRRNRKLRVGYRNYSPIIQIICQKLRRKKIYKIHTAYKPRSLRFYVFRKVVNRFFLSGVKIMNVGYTPKFAHGRAQKTKKARRL